MSDNLNDNRIILYDINCDINSFMAAPTVFRNLISNDCWNKENLIILQTHKFGFIEEKGNNLVTSRCFNFGLNYCLKNRLIEKRNILSFCFKKILTKLQKKSNLFNNFLTYKIYRKIIKKYNINYIVRGTYFNDSLSSLIKINKKTGIKYTVVTVDPIFSQKINRPSRKLTNLESKLIKKSEAYYVPEYCFENYVKKFNFTKKIKSFCFPIAIEYSSNPSFKTERLSFSYFGTMRKDYHLFDKIFANIKSSYNGSLKFYGWTNEKLAKKVGGKHLHPVVGDKLIEELFKADFLIALDNPPHMIELLPSKIILYASSTKPIIVFGENDDSALLKFLKKIKYERYIYIRPTDSYELLNKFIKEYSNVSFDEECYKRQSDYYPSNVSFKLYSELFDK